MTAPHVRVFVSYAHDTVDHSKNVTALVEDLRHNGLDARFDRDVNGSPAEGWPAWMEEQVRTADHVLVVCSEIYLRRYEGREERGKGKGAILESQLLRQEMYDRAGRNTKFAAVLFAREDEQHIPQPLRPYTYYLYPPRRTDLLRWLTSQPAYLPAPIGLVPSLPPDP